MTRTLRLRAEVPADLQRAADLLRSGGIVAFPTETVYGLGANALSAEAVARIFVAKQRPHWDPLIVHLADAAEIPRIAVVGEALQARVSLLTEAFWPGPMTLLLPRAAIIPDLVTAGRTSVGARIPAHPVAQALLRMTGIPLAAPSANRFGHISPTTAEHVLHDLDGRIDAVLDGGPSSVGVESSVLDPVPTPMVLYRAGALTPAMLEQVSGVTVRTFEPSSLRTEEQSPESLPSPGVGIRHYAPEARVWLAEPEAGDLKRVLAHVLAQVAGPVGVLLPVDWQLPQDERVRIEHWARWDDAEALAAGLYGSLRALERSQVDAILCPLPEPGGLRDALRDRLLKAARTR